MRTFYALHVHRKDGSWHRHLMRGELPKPGDTVPAILSRKEAVMAKVAQLSELAPLDEERSIVAIKVDADEVGCCSGIRVVLYDEGGAVILDGPGWRAALFRAFRKSPDSFPMFAVDVLLFGSGIWLRTVR